MAKETLTPFDYQEAAAQHAQRYPQAYLAMDMGTGKTITSLYTVSKSDDGDVLLVTELNEIEKSQNFRKEIETYFDEHFEHINLRKGEQPSGRQRAVCHCNVDFLKKLDPKKSTYKTVIVDEATIGKETTSARFKILKKFCDRADCVLLLSGTPMMNGASELWAQMSLIDAEITQQMTKYQFDEKFCGGKWIPKRSLKGVSPYQLEKFPWKYYAWKNDESHNLRLLRYMLDEMYFVDKDVTGLFKPKQTLYRGVEMTPENLAEYRQTWQTYLSDSKTAKQWAKLQDNENVSSANLKRIIERGQMYQVNSKYRVQQFLNDVEAGEADKIIAFVHFDESFDLLCQGLEDRGINHCTFEEIDRFKEDPTIRVIVGKLIAHGKGGNIPEANVTALIDSSPVPAQNIQAGNRMDRPQQTRPMKLIYYQVTVPDYATDFCVDSRMREINEKKMADIKEFTRQIEFGEIEELDRQKQAFLKGL